ncbi:MAG: DUF1294 domain-containing protein [Evtepia sp.]
MGAGLDGHRLCPHGHRQSQGKRDTNSVSGKMLFLSAILGGSVGSLVGMSLFRHKTKHWSFRIRMLVILLVQVALLLLWSFRHYVWVV